MVAKAPGKKGLEGLAQKFGLGAGVWNSSDSVLDNVSQPEWVDAGEQVLSPVNEDESAKLKEKLEEEERQKDAIRASLKRTEDKISDRSSHGINT